MADNTPDTPIRWAHDAANKITGLASAARKALEAPEDGFEIETGMAVVAILEIIRDLGDEVGGYLAELVEPN